VASKYTPGTLPDHERCTVHRHHKLGCAQYEQLLARSGQRCEICDLPGRENVRGKLHIDHLGHDWAVRGLLCNSCNTALNKDAARRNARWAAEYLANSWWVKECERLGVSIELAPEPDCGSAIRDQFNVVWLREGDGMWRPRGHGRPGISSASWEWLYEQRGPQNMALLDVDREDRGEFGLWHAAERAMLQALITESHPDFRASQYRGTVTRFIETAAALWPASGASNRSFAPP